MTVALLIEGGGSGTWIGVLRDDALPAWHRTGSLDPNGGASSDPLEVLAPSVEQLREGHGVTGPIELVVAGLSIATSSRAAARLAEQIVAAGAPGRCVSQVALVVNDIAPLLDWRQRATSVAAICGTGTGYAARDHDGTIRRASGEEYILSDEGGGFDVGLAGLRAATRSLDGRGPATSLVDAAIQYGNGSFRGLRGRIYGNPSVGIKQRVAGFAAAVLEAAGDGDEVAIDLIEHSAAEIVTGVRAVFGPGDPARAGLTLAGSMLRGGQRILDRAVRRRLDEASMHFETVETVDSARDHLVALAQRLLGGTISPEHLLDSARFIPVGCARLAPTPDRDTHSGAT